MFRGLSRAEAVARLRQYVREVDNGIQQHSEEWVKDKVRTVGGSSMGTIMGLNPYQDITEMISQRVGLSQFSGSVATQWGNLFEDIIKRFVEWDLNTEILGEDLYVKDPKFPHVAYSPDGLAIIDNKRLYQRARKVEAPDTECALLEFKAPYSRMPGAEPPEYYVPQPLMGMCVLPATTSLFVETVIRPCMWEQLDGTQSHQNMGQRAPPATPPIAMGAIGIFAYKVEGKLMQALSRGNMLGMPDNMMSYDIAKMPKSVFDKLIVDMRNTVHAWPTIDDPSWTLPLIVPMPDNVAATYPDPQRWIDERVGGGAKYGATNPSNDEIRAKFDAYVKTHEQYCIDNKLINVGVFTWKMYRTEYHWIERQEGFLDAHLPTIAEIIAKVDALLALPLEKREAALYNRDDSVTTSAFDDSDIL